MPKRLGVVELCYGFQTIRFVDFSGNMCKITSRTKPALSTVVMVGAEERCMLLDKELAERLVITIQKWIDSGQFE